VVLLRAITAIQQDRRDQMPNLLERRYFALSTINLRLAAAQQLSHEASLAGFSAWILLQESEG